jgi:hypothetical protein
VRQHPACRLPPASAALEGAGAATSHMKVVHHLQGADAEDPWLQVGQARLPQQGLLAAPAARRAAGPGAAAMRPP